MEAREFGKIRPAAAFMCSERIRAACASPHKWGHATPLGGDGPHGASERRHGQVGAVKRLVHEPDAGHAGHGTSLLHRFDRHVRATGFQADNITGRFFHVVLIAVPITLQVYFNAGLAYGLMKWLKVEHSVAAPGALIGASNFFELAVATAIALFGPESGAALATVVGVLVEVPVMLSVCAACNRTRHWFPEAKIAPAQ